MNKEFIRVRSVKDYTIVSLLIVAGAILSTIRDNDPLSITGCFLIVAGVVLTFFLKTGYKDKETGIRYRKSEWYFQQTMHAPIKAAIETKPESIDVSQEEKGNSIKLDVYYSESRGKAYLQLFEYIPYKYEPCTAVYEHELSKVKNLIK
ncbi:MAG: hypothetical protein IJN02_11295 [Bacteroidales bacterium]|nr:hypothetical protein [Bacteroidales bacterium]